VLIMPNNGNPPMGRACPSARCDEAAQVLGTIDARRRVIFLGKPLSVTAEFVASASEHLMTPEARFRFTSACVQGQCKQWTGTACSVATAAAAISVEPQVSALPSCGIRPRCQWFFQEGPRACAACDQVATRLT